MHATLTNLFSVNSLRNKFRFTMIAPLALSLALHTTTALAETGTINSNGVNIQYVDEGEGEVVIFLHGFAGSSEMWRAIDLMPMEGFRTIAFDARGHGASDKPDSVDAYGFALVDDIVALMKARDVPEAHFVGYSMGGETALRLAVSYPERVSSLVVAGSGWSSAEQAAAYSFFSAALAESYSFGDFMAAMGPADQDLPPEAMEAMGALLAAHGIDPAQSATPLSAVAAGLPEIISLDVSELATITVPVLGIAGTEDPESDTVAALAEVLPDFTFFSIDGADHLMTPVSPEFASAITGFLND
jgi:pimeloyl-ACP methyl ester carboxylesterase